MSCLDTACGCSFGAENSQFSEKVDKEVCKVGIRPRIRENPVREGQGEQNLRMPRADRL